MTSRSRIVYLIDFRKERAREIIAAIHNGGAIPAPSNGWNRYEMLHVAGAMYFAIWSQGPANLDLERFDNLPTEHREASEEMLTDDVHDAIEFCGQLTMMIADDEYDDHCESHVQAIGSGKKTQFIQGGKSQ